jgi:hypothetical protein
MICRTEPYSPYLPSPTQIREQCRRIQGEWSVAEKASRRADCRQAWKLLVARHPRFDRTRRFDLS